MGPYVADFACLAARLIVELDGRQHLSRRNYDQSRTNFFESEGFQVIRFNNSQIYRRMKAVLAAIESALEARPLKGRK
jgi:very-short-patch-repair endonuclease